MIYTEECPRCNGHGRVALTKESREVRKVLAKGPLRTIDIAKRLKLNYPAALARMNRMLGRGLVKRGTDLYWRNA